MCCVHDTHRHIRTLSDPAKSTKLSAICVCVCVYVYKCVYAVYICLYICVYVRVCTCISLCVCMCDVVALCGPWFVSVLVTVVK